MNLLYSSDWLLLLDLLLQLLLHHLLLLLLGLLLGGDLGSRRSGGKVHLLLSNTTRCAHHLGVRMTRMSHRSSLLLLLLRLLLGRNLDGLSPNCGSAHNRLTRLQLKLGQLLARLSGGGNGLWTVRSRNLDHLNLLTRL